jgi:hypothetical protein
VLLSLDGDLGVTIRANPAGGVTVTIINSHI